MQVESIKTPTALWQLIVNMSKATTTLEAGAVVLAGRDKEEK